MASAVLENYLFQHGLCLQTTEDPTKGRAVISFDHHKRGTVLITSQPLGAITLPSRRHEICNYCFRKPAVPTALQRCSQCKAAYFCDMACFKNAWLTYHQYVCKPRQEEILDDDNQDALDLEMLERVALNCWRYNKRNPQQQPTTLDIDDDYTDQEGVDVTMQAFHSLMGHESEQSKQSLLRFRNLAQKALSHSYLADAGLTADELVHYLCQFQCNNFGVHDEQLFTIGEGTYPVASLINHSCRPNAIAKFDGALLSIVAIEDIEPDQEVTIGYVDIAHDRSHRQSSLTSKYFFSCQCVRCSDSQDAETRIYSEIDSLLGNELSEWERAQSLLVESQQDSTTTLRDRILQQIKDWDLLEMCRLYDRRHDGVPDKTKPLTLASYTHYVIQFFAPYLWSINNPKLSVGSVELPSSSMSAIASNNMSTVTQQYQLSAPPPLPSSPPRGLTHFDDPLPHAARPKVPNSYVGVLEKLLAELRSYPVSSDNDIVPYHLTTLATSTQLLYDEMNLGHWRNAVKLGTYVLIQYCWIYPPYHPILAQHLLLLAKCCWNSIIKSELLGENKHLENVYERGVRRWIMLSKETLACSVGKGEQWREIIELEWIFLREQKLKE